MVAQAALVEDRKELIRRHSAARPSEEVVAVEEARLERPEDQVAVGEAADRSLPDMQEPQDKEMTVATVLLVCNTTAEAAVGSSPPEAMQHP